MNQSAVAPAKPRKETIRALLVEIFEELSGLDIASEDPAASFLEIGFDSLFLTQVTQSLQSKFGIKITFRQLMDDLSTLEHLSAYVDAHVALRVSTKKLPRLLRRLAEPVAGLALAAAEAPAPGSAMEELMKNQLLALNQLFAQQIAALNGGAATPAIRTRPCSCARAGRTALPQPLRL